MVESDLQQDHLYNDHDDGLDEQRIVEVRLGPIEESGGAQVSGLPDTMMKAGRTSRWMQPA